MYGVLPSGSGTVDGVIAELYPEAWAHLGAARRAKAELALTWGALLADGLADFSVTNNPDGRGQIVAYADWPHGTQADLTVIFRTCLEELWASLDSLITESVAMFSILRQPRNPNASRYFPIADSVENFDALLAESCVDGILQLQFDMIRDCQPFEREPEDERIERFRFGLRQLLDWSNRLETGSQVSAWATPIAPQVHADAPAKLIHLEPQPPGELHEERLVARFALSEYTSRTTVTGQAGTYVDLAFPDGFDPRDPDDTFDRRLEFVIDIVTRFAVSFAWLATKAPGAKRIILGTNRDPAETWIEASCSPRRWTKRELDSLAHSDLGLGVVQDTSQLTLIVQTADGIYERMIRTRLPYDRILSVALPQNTQLKTQLQRGAFPTSSCVRTLSEKGLASGRSVMACSSLGTAASSSRSNAVTSSQELLIGRPVG